MEKEYYCFKIRFIRFAFTLVMVFVLSAGNSSGQILWSTPTGQAWLTATNWTGGIVPNTTDIAQFATEPTSGVTGVGINMNGATNNGLNNQAVGAIEITAARSAGMLIGNSSTSQNGTLTLNGANVNGTNNVILSNNSPGLLTIQDEQALGSQTMEIALANVTENIIVIDGAGGIAISSVISGAGKNLTLFGIGSGVLSLTAANTYTGVTNVASGTLQLNNAGGGTLPSANNITIGATGTLRISTDQVINNFTMNSGGGVLLIDAGATLTITGTYNVSGGTINNQGTLKLSCGPVFFPGTAVVVNNGTAGTMTNLEIATTGDVTQTAPFSISGALTLTTGIVNAGTTNYITIKDDAVVNGASNASFIDGKIAKVGNDAFVFPVGKAAVGYVPISISAQPSAGNIYIAEYKRPIIITYPIDPTLIGLDHVSNIDYWILDFSGNPSPIDLTLYWTAQSSSNGSPTYINKLSSLVVAHSNGTFWDSYGGTSFATGNVTAGSVTWAGVNVYGPFSLGSIDFGNPLPVNLDYFDGLKQNGSHYLNWKITCSNSPNTAIILQRSADAINFKDIATVTADALRCQQPFEYTDNYPIEGTNYYRLKITAANGKVTYSSIIALLNKATGFDIVNLMPSLVTKNAVLNITTAKKAKMDVLITDVTGRLVQKIVYDLIAGSNQFNLNLGNLSAGTYQITGYTSEDRSRTIRFVKQ